MRGLTLLLRLHKLIQVKNEHITPHLSLSANSEFALCRNKFFHIATETRIAEIVKRTLKKHLKWKMLEVNW